jgi:DNA-binding transcriptional regulator YiaG
MEILMFSLKFDLLFPSLDMAKAAAKKLNTTIRRPARDIDPRELKRMRDELALSREKVRMQATLGRHLFL